MKTKTFAAVLVLSSIVLAQSSEAEIQQIHAMTEILPFITADTLLVFDLDNTVIHPVQTLGSDQWFQYLLKSNLVDQSVAIWSEVQKYTQVEAVESVTPGLILKEQNEGLKVMALTARPANLAQTTIQQLQTVDVDFTQSPVYGQDLALGDESFPQFISGIEFVSPKFSKGEALAALLNKIAFKPRRVVFVDDTPKHTVTVNQAMDAAGIENFEFRYGADDARVAAFNPDIARVEYAVFENCGFEIISDSDASTRTAQNPVQCP